MSETINVDHYITARQAACCIAVKRDLPQAEVHNIAEVLQQHLGAGPIRLATAREALDALGLDVTPSEMKIMKAAAATVAV